MKTVIIIILTGQIYLFLALCFFVVHRTGSTEALADIGNTTLLSVAAAALAVAAGFRRK